MRETTAVELTEEELMDLIGACEARYNAMSAIGWDGTADRATVLRDRLALVLHNRQTEPTAA